MVRLTGTAAAARLHDWWQLVHAGPPGQHVIHVHQVLRGQGSGFRGLSSYQRWARGGSNAVADALAMTAEEDYWRPYAADALRVVSKGGANTRIIIVPPDWDEDPTDWRRYVHDVHWPFFVAMTAETILWLRLDDYLKAGLSEREADINQWGHAGTIRTGYAPDGGIGHREFLQLGWPESQKEQAFIEAALRVALADGELIAPAIVPA